MATVCKLSLLFIFFSFCEYLLSYASPEADILLTFKSSIEDPMNSLMGWSNTTAVHHCNWTAAICGLPSLTHLNLADNFFNQPIPLHLSQCGSLENLNLSNNLIWGTIPDQISQFGSLKFLDFGRNHLEGNIPESIGSLKELQVLNLCSNLLSGNIPQVFGNFTQLLTLDLSQNSLLVSEIPGDIGKLSKLEKLILGSSGFYGEIVPNFFEGLKSLAILDLSQNNLTGKIPGIGLSLPNLVSFDVSQNRLSGPFPVGVCNGKGLQNLALHENFLNGSIPNDSINECIKLERFQVQNNRFTENFPSWLWSLPRIKIIRAENNRFSGVIPESISKAAELEQVEIDNNSFTSKIPDGLGMVTTLYKFSASLNGLYGELPPNFCDSPVMSILNLSQNYLSGEIPELRNCKKLVSLSLAHNSFAGEIPKSLAQLPVLTYLDLSLNNLTGPIPDELQNLKLALFNVSFNRLSGRVPSSLISGPPASSLQGNPGLCGWGLPNSCSDDRPTHKNAKMSRLAYTLMSIALAIAIIMAVGFYMIRRSQKPNPQMGSWRSVFFYPLRVTENDLIMAMDEKAARGNSETLGRIYVVNLPSGEPVAVKKLVNFGKQSSKSLKSEVKTLAKVRHKNITKILGFCHSSDSIFLIYEYVANGSLGDLIGKSDINLSWSRNAEQTEPWEGSLDVVKWVRRKINITNGAVQLLDPKISGSSQQQMLEVLEIALHCTAVMPDKRPSMADVVRELQSLSIKIESTNLEISDSGNTSVPF
nr:probably inactive leucine-rich repeat receptor-like protein kinase At5g06940 [Ipomoea batatas]